MTSVCCDVVKKEGKNFLEKCKIITEVFPQGINFQELSV